ncbi:MAG: hypothetical protein ACI4HQ_07610 [Acetatifactor sp.]
MSVKPIYHKNLRLGESIKAEKLDKIIKKLESKPMFSGVFVIAVSRNFSDQLEIYQARELAHKYYENNPPYIIGLAGSKDEAIHMIENLVQCCMKERGDCALKEYLL